MSSAASAELAKQIEDRALSAAGQALYGIINAATSPDQIANLGRTLWHQWGLGELSDDEATFLSEAIEKRKPVHRPMAMKALGALRDRISRFTPRQRQRSPDRKASRDRRRTLGSSSSMPPDLRALFTEGQRAVLAIIAGEVKHHGTCDLPYDAIAAKAGVCRTTVQTTTHEARRLSLINITERPRPGRKNLTNVIRIMSREWLAWLERGPTAHRPPLSDMGVDRLKQGGGIGSNSVKMVSPTKNTDSKKEESGNEEREFDPTRRAGPASKGSAYARIAARLGQSADKGSG
jgi:hypothetical protein